MVDKAAKERQKIIARAVREAAKPYRPPVEFESPAIKSAQRKQIWAVDFDGCLCENRWPSIGPPNEELIMILRCIRKAGVAVILWTCREGQLLDEAVAWCEDHGLIFDAVNDNLPEICEAYGGNPRKLSATLYLDDRAVHVDRKDWCKELWDRLQETLPETT